MEKRKQMHWAMVLAAFFWSGAFIAGKIGVQEFSPFALTFFRFFFATMLIFGLLWRRERKNWRLESELWPLAIVLGIVGMFGYHILFFTALKYTTAVNSSLIGATNPLITSILAILFLGEVFDLKRMVAVVIALIGVALTVSQGKLETFLKFNFNIGDLVMLLAVICWASYAILSKKAKGRTAPLKLMAYVFFVCTIFLIPFVIYEGDWQHFAQVSWRGWSAVLYMAIFSSVLGYLIQLMSIQEIGASRTAVYINLVPVFSMFLSYLILHESIGWFRIFSASLIIGGVYLSSKVREVENSGY